MNNKICMGVWGMTNLRDRFNVNGFGEEVAVTDRIKQVGETKTISVQELRIWTEMGIWIL